MTTIASESHRDTSDLRADGPADRVGFACMWERDAPTTWSGTAWGLLQGLQGRADVVDLGVHAPQPVRLAYKAAFTRRHGGRFVTTYKNSRLWRRHAEWELTRAVRRHPVDAVVQIGDLAVLPAAPCFFYQDLCYDVLLDTFDDAAGEAQHFPGLGRDGIARLRERQLDLYDRAAGVLTMSRWLAEVLVDRCGVPAAKVHVVHPGVEITVDPQPRPRLEGPRRRLLFIGRDFHRKGGDLVVQALGVLRRDVDPDITLTIAGPPTWPMSGRVPDGVDFLGPVSGNELNSLYRRHDVFVMPSRLEAFGKVFAEARAHGLPCVGRNVFAMPELIEPGRSGALVESDDVDHLARVIATVLADDDVFASVQADRQSVIDYFTWDRAAADALAAVNVRKPIG